MLEADAEKLRLLFVELYGRHCWSEVFTEMFRAKGCRSVNERQKWLISERLERLESQVR